MSNQWPLSFPPEPDELLTSWMIRLAHANGLQCESFRSHACGSSIEVWNRDVDRYSNERLINALSEISGVSATRLWGATLRYLQSAMAGQVECHGTRCGLLSLGVYHRTRRRSGLMYCPACINSDSVPYFRKLWRVSLLIGCPEHHVTLADACPHCGVPIIPHRADVFWQQSTTAQSRLYVRCWSCGHDLRDTESSRMTSGIVAYTRRIQDALLGEWGNLGGVVLHPRAFLAGVQVLLRVAAKQVGEEHFDLLPLQIRAERVERVSAWLDDWPAAFLADMRRMRRTYTSIHPSRLELPFWIEKVVRESLLIKRAERSAVEISAMLDYLDRQHGAASGFGARKYLQHSIDTKRMPAQYRGDAALEDYQDLVINIDHTISLTPHGRTRDNYIADKIWIVLGCVHGLSLETIARLTIRDVTALAKGATRHSFDVPRSFPEIAYWLRWYLKSLRPELGLMEELAPAFPRYDGRRAITSNGLGMRFTTHLHRANLNRRVWSYAKLSRCVAEKSGVK